MKKIELIRWLLVTFALMAADMALASTGGALPWEGPLAKISQSFSGPVAAAISVIGIVASGAALIWGGEISGFFRGVVIVVLVASVCLGANTIVQWLGGTSGAVLSGDLAECDHQTNTLAMDGCLAPALE